MEEYFDYPVQARWKTEDNDEWNYGIGYCTELICGCCGGVTELDEVVALEILPWVDIAHEIKGFDHSGWEDK